MQLSTTQPLNVFSTRQSGSLPSRRVRRDVSVQAHQGLEHYAGRREVTAGVLATIAALPASPALAIFGFGEDSEAKYVSDTTGIIGDVRSTLALGREDPAREEAVKKVRKETNDWVARYRRDNTYAGRPSFGNVYSALNALAGHFNSFGTTAPIPKKRLDRIIKELDDAEKLINRGR